MCPGDVGATSFASADWVRGRPPHLEVDMKAKYQLPLCDMMRRNSSWKRSAAPYARMVGRPWGCAATG